MFLSSFSVHSSVQKSQKYQRVFFNLATLRRTNILPIDTANGYHLICSCHMNDRCHDSVSKREYTKYGKRILKIKISLRTCNAIQEYSR